MREAKIFLPNSSETLLGRQSPVPEHQCRTLPLEEEHEQEKALLAEINFRTKLDRRTINNIGEHSAIDQ